MKENLEMLFAYRQATGFRPSTPEPDEGWLGELAAGWFRVMADLERNANQQLPAPPNLFPPCRPVCGDLWPSHRLGSIHTPTSHRNAVLSIVRACYDRVRIAPVFPKKRPAG